MNLKKSFLIAIPTIFILIQFFQPEKNQMGIGDNHIINEIEIPDTIKSILTISCLDCHSNQTNYRWYNKISPVSWIINDHIKEGKNEVNFSDWKTLDVYDKISILDEVSDEITNKKMPLKSYTLIHQEAKLNEEQVNFLNNWIESYSEKLLEISKEQQ